MITGALAALAGCVIASQLGEGQGDIGANVELGVITIVIVGGNAVSGGEGAMWRTATGIGILAILGNAFDHLQVSTFWQEVIEGVIIIAALAIDAYGKRACATIEALPMSAPIRRSPNFARGAPRCRFWYFSISHVNRPACTRMCCGSAAQPFTASNSTSTSPFPTGMAFDAIIAMGGPMSVNDEEKLPWLRNEKALINEAVRAGVPVLRRVPRRAVSVGQSRRHRVPWPKAGGRPASGFLNAEAASDPVFAGIPREMLTFQWHGDTFSLPAGSVLLASSPAFPHQAFRWGARAYGLQFHLEVSLDMAEDWLRGAGICAIAQ